MGVHLVVLIHGLWGSPVHLSAAKQELEQAWTDVQSTRKSHKHTEFTIGADEDPTIVTELRGDNSSELVTMIAGGMTSQLTYDGIDVCASRVAYEVDQELSRLDSEGKDVTHFSVTGYSLGGLVARYLVGLLHARSPSFFNTYRPVSFSTIATPHLGIPRYNTYLSTTLTWLGSRLLSRSGEQLYVSDTYDDHDPRPLLEIMADPRIVFYRGLEQFARLQIFANGVKDRTVPYPSAAIERVDHFAKWEDEGLQIDADVDCLIRSWNEPHLQAGDRPVRRKPWANPVDSLPPVLRYRFPFNYMILLLLPIMLPLIIAMMASRLAMDSRRSQRRLRDLASTHHSGSTATLPDPASGLSVQTLRATIKSIERGIKIDMIEVLEQFDGTSETQRAPRDASGALALSESQQRMVSWLNRLPLMKYTTWFPQVANAHAVCVVRDPQKFPAHNAGRGVLRRWARGVVDA